MKHNSVAIALLVLVLCAACPLTKSNFGRPCQDAAGCGESFSCVDGFCIPNRLVDGGVGLDSGVEVDSGVDVDGGFVEIIDSYLLQPEDITNADSFGEAVAASNRWLVIGAPGGVGRVYIYEIDDSSVAYRQTLSSTPSVGFGSSVAVVEDVIFVGSPFATIAGNTAAGTVEAFDWNPAADIFEDDGLFQTVSEGDVKFGATLAVRAKSPNDYEVAIGQPGLDVEEVANAGGVLLLRRENKVWTTIRAFESPSAEFGGEFGRTIAWSPNGLALAIGAPNEDPDQSTLRRGRVHVFTRPAVNGDWVQAASVEGPGGLLNNGAFGSSLSFDENNELFVGMPEFAASDTEFVDRLGIVVHYDNDFNLDDRVITMPLAANPFAGGAIALSGSQMFVGIAPRRNVAAATLGSIYRLEKQASGFTAIAEVTTAIGSGDNLLGYALATTGGLLFAGAPGSLFGETAVGTVVVVNISSL